ncbi:MAG TPA: hypothetical protein VMM12_16350 [Longimicrobiales bacterium]|nr:hypothetical protein [Longimicrobiales bacterium]
MNLLILTIVGVLGISAAAAAVMGNSYDDVTPHGQLLGTLQRVADAQKRHHARTGAFAQWIQTLHVEAGPDVRITLLRGDATEWDAVVRHDGGLACMRSGRAEGVVVHTDPATCFTTER